MLIYFSSSFSCDNNNLETNNFCNTLKWNDDEEDEEVGGGENHVQMCISNTGNNKND